MGGGGGEKIRGGECLGGDGWRRRKGRIEDRGRRVFRRR